MGAELRINGSRGNILIDENFNTMYLVKKGTYHVLKKDDPQATSVVAVFLRNALVYTRASSTSLICFRSDNKAMLGIIDGPNGSVYIFSDRDTNVTVYEFAKKTEFSPNSLFQLYREDGTVAFDASAKPMRVIAATNMNIGDSNTSISPPVFIATEPAGKAYAFCPTQIASRYIFQNMNGPFNSQLYLGFCSGYQYGGNSGNDIYALPYELYRSVTRNVVGNNKNYGTSSSRGFIVDVSNY